MKSVAPSSIARTARLTDPTAVIRMIGVSGCEERSSRNTISPSPSGI
jgi:hypothetical protein